MLDRLEAVDDRAARARVHTADPERRLGGHELAELYGDEASLAVSPAVGRLLHRIVLDVRPALVVEFGCSLGYAAIHLAAGLRDAGGGRLVTTELRPAKARAARANLDEAGLGDLVEIRVGDARSTLAETPGTVGLLFLDGWNDLYEDVVVLLEPRLAPGALVVADLSAGDPRSQAYRERMRRAVGYRTHELPLSTGVLVSLRP